MRKVKRVIRKCESCAEIITGRADKKFCSYYCRNDYHNRLRRISNKHIRNVNNILRKNRRIMERLLSMTKNKKTIRVDKTILHTLGFKPKYHTHTSIDKEGKTYFFCYDYGYHELNTRYQIVRKEINKKRNRVTSRLLTKMPEL